jgi:hypothetical protein
MTLTDTAQVFSKRAFKIMLIAICVGMLGVLRQNVFHTMDAFTGILKISPAMVGTFLIVLRLSFYLRLSRTLSV